MAHIGVSLLFLRFLALSELMLFEMSGNVFYVALENRVWIVPRLEKMLKFFATMKS